MSQTVKNIRTKGFIRSYGELVSAWKEMVVVSFGTQSRHWPLKTKENQENFQSGQLVSGTRTESGISRTWSRKGKNSTLACRWHPACFTVGLFQTDVARSGLIKVTLQHLPKGTWYYQENLSQQCWSTIRESDLFPPK